MIFNSQEDRDAKMAFREFFATKLNIDPSWQCKKWISTTCKISLNTSDPAHFPTCNQHLVIMPDSLHDDIISATEGHSLIECLEVWKREVATAISERWLTDFRAIVIITALLSFDPCTYEKRHPQQI